MCLPAGGSDDRIHRRTLCRLQHLDQHRLLGTGARCRLLGCGRFGRMITNGGREGCARHRHRREMSEGGAAPLAEGSRYSRRCEVAIQGRRHRRERP